jgi:hypothetical protein
LALRAYHAGELHLWRSTGFLFLAATHSRSTTRAELALVALHTSGELLRIRDGGAAQPLGVAAASSPLRGRKHCD